MIVDVKDKYKELISELPYEHVLAGAVARAIEARMRRPYDVYPLAVESLVIALPSFGNIEKDIQSYIKNEWSREKKQIDNEEPDKIRRKILYYDRLMVEIKHKLEAHGLLLRFRELPFGGSYDK